MSGEQLIEYAKALATVLDLDPLSAPKISMATNAAGVAGVADPDVRDLLVAAFDLVDTLAQTRADYDRAVARWREVRNRKALHDRILEVLAAPLAAIPPLQDLVKTIDLDAQDGLRFDQTIGPLTVHLDGGAVFAEMASGSEFARDVLGPRLPDMLGADLLAGPATGGGTLRIRQDGMAGVLGLAMGPIAVSAIASLKLGADGTPSFLGILGVTFKPGLQVGFGFALDRVGGLVGVNRRADVDALGRALRGGTLGDVLFSSNPEADAPRILGAVDELFPSRTGSHLFGPMLRIGWLSIGVLTLFSLDVGVILELPGPARIVIVGVARAGIPPVLQLRLDMLGAIDFEQGELALGASLVDSGVLGIFVITGDAALRISWGAQKYTVLSIGGFYPGFDPRPAQLPPLARAGMHLDLPVPGITMRAEAYFAVTSNTLQFGGHLETGFDAAAVSATGFIGLDTLIQFSPFHLHAEVSAGFHVEVAGLTFCGVRLDGTIDAPSPVVISGRLTVETFLFDISWHQTFTLGEAADTRTPPGSLLDELRPELTNPANLHSGDGADRLVRLDPKRVGGTLATVFPLADLVWVQRRAPLDLPIDRLGGVPLGSTQRVAVTVASSAPAPVSRPERALFSPGSFITLTPSEALNKPAFEELDGGVRMIWPLQSSPGNHAVPVTFQLIRKVRGDEPVRPPEPPSLSRASAGAGVHAMIDGRDRAAKVSDRLAMVGVAAEQWATDAGTSPASATAAHQEVRMGGAALALPATDLGRPINLAGI